MGAWTFLRRLFESSDAPVRAETRIAVQSPSPRREVPVAEPTSAAAEPAAAGVLAGQTSDILRARLGHDIDVLRAELDAQHITPDLLELLNALSDDPSGHLRQLPTAAQQALAACDDPNVPTQALVPLFERDPALTKALLARANSAYYNPSGTPCLSLAPAINRQGRRSAHNVILEQVMSGLVCRPGRMWNAMVGRVWSHMVRTGPIARAVAPALGVDPEQAFALGLLHDVGKLVIFDGLAAQRAAKREELIISAPAIKHTLRLLHEPLGGLCALRWELGDDAAMAIATHHREPRPEPRNPLSEVTWLAEKIDLTERRHLPVDIEALWVQGSLTGDPVEAARLLATYRGDDAQAS